MALTNPVDAQDVDPADPQVTYSQASLCPLVHSGVQTFCCICSSTRYKCGDGPVIMSGQIFQTALNCTLQSIQIVQRCFVHTISPEQENIKPDAVKRVCHAQCDSSSSAESCIHDQLTIRLPAYSRKCCSRQLCASLSGPNPSLCAHDISGDGRPAAHSGAQFNQCL